MAILTTVTSWNVMVCGKKRGRDRKKKKKRKRKIIGGGGCSEYQKVDLIVLIALILSNKNAIKWSPIR